MARIYSHLLLVAFFLDFTVSISSQPQFPPPLPTEDDEEISDFTDTRWLGTARPTNHKPESSLWQNYTSTTESTLTLPSSTSSCIYSEQGVRYVTHTTIVSFTITKTITGNLEQTGPITLPPIVESPPPFCFFTRSISTRISPLSSTITPFPPPPPPPPPPTSTIHLTTKTSVVVIVPASTLDFGSQPIPAPAPTSEAAKSGVPPATPPSLSSRTSGAPNDPEKSHNTNTLASASRPHASVTAPAPETYPSTGDENSEQLALKDPVSMSGPVPDEKVQFRPPRTTLEQSPPSHTLVDEMLVSAGPAFVLIGTRSVLNPASTAITTAIDGNTFIILPNDEGVIIPNGNKLIPSGIKTKEGATLGEANPQDKATGHGGADSVTIADGVSMTIGAEVITISASTLTIPPNTAITIGGTNDIVFPTTTIPPFSGTGTNNIGESLPCSRVITTEIKGIGISETNISIPCLAITGLTTSIGTVEQSNKAIALLGCSYLLPIVYGWILWALIIN